MHARLWLLGSIVVFAAAWTGRPAQAEVTSLHGGTRVELAESRTDGLDNMSQSAAADYPEMSPTLPLRVVVRLIDANDAAAAVAAAQFADPSNPAGADPDELALSMAFGSVTSDTSYTGSAAVEEVRGVRFLPAEVSRQTGQTARMSGRIFVDGVLAIYAGKDVIDLTGAQVTLRVVITKEVEGQAPQKLFEGTLTATGGTNGQVSVAAGGSFPTIGIFQTDLSGVDADLDIFQAIVFPNLAIDYPYDAVVGEEFALRAKVEVEGANAPGEIGAAALIGTPLEAMGEVLSATRGETSAAKMLTALQLERATPTGKPAFADTDTGSLPLLCDACGLIGFETVLGTLALIGLRVGNPYRRRSAR